MSSLHWELLLVAASVLRGPRWFGRRSRSAASVVGITFVMRTTALARPAVLLQHGAVHENSRFQRANGHEWLNRNLDWHRMRKSARSSNPESCPSVQKSKARQASPTGISWSSHQRRPYRGTVLVLDFKIICSACSPSLHAVSMTTHVANEAQWRILFNNIPLF